MNFKKLMVMVMLSISTTNMVAAQSNKYVISTEPLSVIAAGTVDDKIVNNAGMTGKSVRLMLNKMCQERAGISLQKLVTEGTKSPITEPHYNTQILNGGLQVYLDRSPSGEAWKWNGRSLIKDECCNMIGNDRQVLVDFLANYAKQSSQRSETYKVENPNTDDGSSSSDQKDNKKQMDTVKVILSGAATVDAGTTNSSSMPWWAIVLIILGSLMVLALIAWIIHRLTPRPADEFISNLEEVHRVEDRVIRRNRRQVQDAELDRYDRNQTAYDEENRQRTRYGRNN